MILYAYLNLNGESRSSLLNPTRRSHLGSSSADVRRSGWTASAAAARTMADQRAAEVPARLRLSQLDSATVDLPGRGPARRRTGSGDSVTRAGSPAGRPTGRATARSRRLSSSRRVKSLASRSVRPRAQAGPGRAPPRRNVTATRHPGESRTDCRGKRNFKWRMSRRLVPCPGRQVRGPAVDADKNSFFLSRHTQNMFQDVRHFVSLFDANVAPTLTP
jgi:hypothetical protein